MLGISSGEGHSRRPDGSRAVDLKRQKQLSRNRETNVVQIEDAAVTRVNSYAKCEDFRMVFLENLESLYQLCFLLTSDPDKAEQCLLAGLDDCVGAHQVFREWAHPWAKRTLVRNAIRALQPRPNRAKSSAPATDVLHGNLLNAEDACFNITSVLSLQDFERVVFVLSVLDFYSDRDCAFLLGCFVEDIRNARTRALEKLAALSYAGVSNLVGVNEKF
jgi:DNA-directed RNA polymerase specialized sigma24 family protein